MIRVPLINVISDMLLPYYPDIRKKIEVLELKTTPEQYMDSALLAAVITALVFGIALSILAWYFAFATEPIHFFAIIILSLLVFGIPFAYMNIHRLDVFLLRRKREIDYDLVFAVKHLIISLSSGTPLFDALVGVTKGYGRISYEFKKIVERVALGESLTSVLREVADSTPSSAFKRVLIQIANAVVSGADVARSLEAVVDQVAKEQLLEIKEYGQKLNPVVMFYLIIGVIIPSLGVAFFIILLSFIGKGIDLPFMYLVGIALLLGLLQFLFLAFIESTRPKYAILT